MMLVKLEPAGPRPQVKCSTTEPLRSLKRVSYERDFMLSLSDNNQTDIIEVFNFISRYLPWMTYLKLIILISNIW